MKDLRRLIFIAAFFLSGFICAATGPEGFAGEWADKNFHGHSVFQLSVEQTGDTASVFFSANRKDGSGAAPEADGKGKVSGGKLQFTWSDSFSNSGTGTIRKSGADVIVSIKTAQVADSRCMMFYGENIRLKPVGGRR